MGFFRQEYWSGVPLPSLYLPLVLYIFTFVQFVPPSPSPTVSTSPLSMCLYYCPSNRFIYTIFLGEGNGTLLQYSYLENPMDGGAC